MKIDVLSKTETVKAKSPTFSRKNGEEADIIFSKVLSRIEKTSNEGGKTQKSDAPNSGQDLAASDKTESKEQTADFTVAFQTSAAVSSAQTQSEPQTAVSGQVAVQEIQFTTSAQPAGAVSDSALNSFETLIGEGTQVYGEFNLQVQQNGDTPNPSEAVNVQEGQPLEFAAVKDDATVYQNEQGQTALKGKSVESSFEAVRAESYESAADRGIADVYTGKAETTVKSAQTQIAAQEDVQVKVINSSSAEGAKPLTQSADTAATEVSAKANEPAETKEKDNQDGFQQQQGGSRDSKGDDSFLKSGNSLHGRIQFAGVFSGKETALTAEAKGAEIVNQIKNALGHVSQGESKMLTIELVPETLGKIVVEMKLEQGELKLKITAENAATAQLLSDQSDRLKASLTVGNTDSVDVNIGYNENATSDFFGRFSGGTANLRDGDSHTTTVIHEVNGADVADTEEQEALNGTAAGFYDRNRLINYLV